MDALPIETVLATSPVDREAGDAVGRSREGRELRGFRIGAAFGATESTPPSPSGPPHVSISLLGGCHADEPVGPWMLRRLTGWLTGLPARHPAVDCIAWTIVPHANPDGEIRNRAWSGDDDTAMVDPHRCFDLDSYSRSRTRELPGDDIEFGFPRDASDSNARPENLAVAEYLRESSRRAGAPQLHVSFHGMGFAGGPWFLIDRTWIARTTRLREALAKRVDSMGYSLHDVQRHGEKGFHRIARGFCTRPDSLSMRDHFLALDDEASASRFRPSSMEFVRTLKPDALTLVSEMPLFIVPGAGAAIEPGDPIMDRFRREHVPTPVAMPIRDQMSLQLAFLDHAIRTVRTFRRT